MQDYNLMLSSNKVYSIVCLCPSARYDDWHNQGWVGGIKSSHVFILL